MFLLEKLKMCLESRTQKFSVVILFLDSLYNDLLFLSSLSSSLISHYLQILFELEENTN
jgi:hypothetical protein